MPLSLLVISGLCSLVCYVPFVKEYSWQNFGTGYALRSSSTTAMEHVERTQDHGRLQEHQPAGISHLLIP